VIKVATVCTGVGAPEMALKMMGVPHEIVFGCEIDKYARTTYQANFNPHTMYTDMTKESWTGEHYYADLFVGGIPCQAFSLAGKRLGELDPRGLLFYNFYDYVDKNRPKAFVIENVKGLLSDNNGKTFQNWVQLLARSVNTQEILFSHADSLRYNLHYTVLNAKDFGLPQNRERVFLVGIREDLPNTFRFPVGWPLEIRLKDVLEAQVDEKYYLSDKRVKEFLEKKSESGDVILEGEVTPNSQAGKVYGTNGISPTVTAGTHGYALGYISDKKLIPFGNSQDQKLSPIDGISQTISSGHFNQPKVMVEEPIPVRMVGRNPDNPKSRKTGEYREQTIEPYQDGICGTLTTVQKDNLIFVAAFQNGKLDNSKNSREYPQGSRVYHEEGISQTITAQGAGIGGNSGAYQVRNRIRRLSPRECFRLQGFPDSFDISQVSDTQAYRQAGNSIPTTVLMEIMRNLKPILQ
jgi:DNA (cytosine-5)-methyltransferase 1